MAVADNSSGQPRAWQRMLSGRRLDLLDPSPLDVEIEDIAHGLARVARWNGQTTGDHAYSVAQHSLLVLQIFEKLEPLANPHLRMLTLLHDAPEYVIGDMISPFKAVMGGAYKAIEDRLEAAIHLRFSLPISPSLKIKRMIKKADLIAAYYEATMLAGFSEKEGVKYFGRPRGIHADFFNLEPLPTSLVQSQFLLKFTQLEQERQSL